MKTLLLDFYGTLARAVHPGLTIDDVLANRGYTVPPDVSHRWWNGDFDGIEHVEQSESREHYAAWQRERLVALLSEADVHPGEYELILDELHAGRANRQLRAYEEVPEVLRELRARGHRLVVCSNWDWELEDAVAEAGLADAADVLVSSAWAGARKPHPRIFRYTLERACVSADDALFVGDTWGPDVEGPRAVGMCAVYLERADHWPDPTRPGDAARDVARIVDLRGLLELV
jgi:putative hydrolase of the HAD superfamily